MHIILNITDNIINTRFSGHSSAQGSQDNTIYNTIIFDNAADLSMLKGLNSIRIENGLTSRNLSKKVEF